LEIQLYNSSNVYETQKKVLIKGCDFCTSLDLEGWDENDKEGRNPLDIDWSLVIVLQQPV
jgi:hypothetical protein